MDLLAVENVETEWLQALLDDGHDVRRVVTVEGLGEGAADSAVLAHAVQRNRVLLTADQSDFSEPPFEEHPGIIIATIDRTGSEVRRAIRRIERSNLDLSGQIAYVGDWLNA